MAAAVGGSIDIGLHEIGLLLKYNSEKTVDSRETRPGMSIVTGTIRLIRFVVVQCLSNPAE
jgi:hypothetical protein